MGLILLLVCLIGGALATPPQIRYDEFQVHRVMPKTEAQVDALQKLEELNGGYSFWSNIAGVNKSVDIMIPPHLKEDFGDFLSLLDIDAEVFIENVQKKIEEEKSKKLKLGGFDFNDYYRLNDIYAWLDLLAARYPDKVTVIVGGQSYEGREIRGVRVSFSENNANNSVFIEGGIHAREWISPAVAAFILNEVLSSPDPEVRNTAERYDWYIFPVFNPDGYEYTHTTNRLWRKTRVPYLLCRGADPNRNWGYKFNSGGTSSSPCAETYRGPHAFSEPCTKSMSEYISTIQDKLVAYIGLHSYSQLLLIPYGHSPAHVENYDDLYRIGRKGADRLSQRYGTQYTVGNIVEVIYVASGGSMDWVKGTYGTPITYTYELRDQGRHGFLLPANQIIPTGEETVDSLVTILNEFDKLKK